MTIMDEARLREIFLSGGQKIQILDELRVVIEPETSNIVNIFYSELVGHPDAGIFLDNEIVAERLTLALCDWLKMLFSPRTEAEVESYVAFQTHVGQVHARLNIPMHLVVDGMRVVRREICELVTRSNMKPEDVVPAVLLINELVDHVLSLMNESYLSDLIMHDRNTHSLKMQVSPFSLAMECEKQNSFLHHWLNQVMLNLFENATPNMGRLSTLLRTEFGLWVTHKTPLLFSDMEFTRRLERQLEHVDEAVRKTPMRGEPPTSEFFVGLHAINEEVSRTSWILSEAVENILELESGRDALTRLFNRRFLPTVLRHETELSVKHGVPFGILLFDIDHFKVVNDTHGHDAGDAVLRQFSEVISPLIRANDYLFRYGGEEFLVVIGDVTDAIALDLAEKMRASIEAKAFDIDKDDPLKITTSIGIALHDGHPDYQRTITRADAALYQAKEGGRNCCVVSKPDGGD